MVNVIKKPFLWIFLGILTIANGIAVFIKWISIGIIQVFLVIFNYLFLLFKYIGIFFFLIFKIIMMFLRYDYKGFKFIFIDSIYKLGNSIKNASSNAKKLIVNELNTSKSKTTPLLKDDNKLKTNVIEKEPIKSEQTNLKESKKEINKKIKMEKAKSKKELRAKKIANNKKLQIERAKLVQELNSNILKRSNERQTFRYVAKNKDGKIIKGTFEAFSKLDVNSYLVNEGYEVYKIETSSFIKFLYGKSSVIGGKMSNKDLIFFLTQLVTYIKAGIPLTESMRILSHQVGKKKNHRKVFESVVYELTLGESFSSALEKQGNVFPSLLINMLKAAEATGELETTLDDMADYYTEIESTRKQMISAMTYPSLVGIFSLAVITFIMLYVIPKFMDVYSQAGIKIAGITLFIVNIANFLKNNITIILITLIILLIIFIFLFKKIKAFRKIIQKGLMHMPVIGKIIIYNEITIFTKTFSSLLRNNVVITESIEILSKVTTNEIYREIMYDTINNITKGEKISISFKNHWAIPEVAYYMIVTGESTGELAEMMDTVSKYYQEQHRNIINNLKSFIEPIMIISLALIVGVVVLAVIIPMFDLYSSIT